MRVKLCRRCPYTPRDLADHYDPEAALHVCAKCDGEQAMLTNHYPREVHGGENAQQSTISSKWRSDAVRHL